MTPQTVIGNPGHGLTKPELSTVFAALRFYQQHGQGDFAHRSHDIHDLATNGGAFRALDAAGIDDLCDFLNFGTR